MPWFQSLILLLILTGSVFAEDWPQWLGPNRNASTSEKVNPWKGKLKVIWRKPVGEGHSSPVVAGNQVYLHTKSPTAEKEVLTAYGLDTGNIEWESGYDRAANKGLFGNGPRATPAVAGDHVYTFGITGVLTCFHAKTGKKIWQIDTLKKFNAPKLFFGSSCSPLVEDDVVLINVGGKGASIVAFDKETGKVRWKTLDARASYAAPNVTGKNEKREAIFLTAEGLVGLSPRDGKVFWQFPFKDILNESSTTPVITGDMIIGSSITKGSVGLKLDQSGNEVGVKKIWNAPKLPCYFATPVPVGKLLFLVVGTPPPSLTTKADLVCIKTETGKQLWTKPKVGQYHASLIRTGNQKLLMLEEKGDLVLVDPTSEGYRELARSNICGNTWAHAAISNGKLIIRDNRELICLELPR